MKKIALFFALSFVFISTECFAGVTFIVDSPQHSSRNQSGSSPRYNKPSIPSQTPETICRSRGYNMNGCPSGQYGIESCAENGSFYKYCCPNENRYTPSQCKQQGMVAYGGGCHGLYACKPAQ